MTQIEAAAREIASHCEHKSEADIAKIIARHLRRGDERSRRVA